MERFKNMGGYEYIKRVEAEKDPGVQEGERQSLRTHYTARVC